jgi:hypothetical protein
MMGGPDTPPDTRRVAAFGIVTARPMRAVALAAGLLVVALSAGCDRMVSGEGHLTAALVGPGEPFASAVVLVSGDGVIDVSAAEGTRVITRRMPDGEIRAVLIQTVSTGTLQFRIQVRDRSASPPEVRVLQVGDMDDVALEVTSTHRVLIGR